jgi:glycosyltransferase involved in cell wall biosynthesis
MINIALLLSGTFETEYAKKYGLDRDSYLTNYRNDWSWEYLKGLKEQNINPILYLPSNQYHESYETIDGFTVRFLPLKKWFNYLSKISFPPKRLKMGTYWHQLIGTIAFKDSLIFALQEDKIDLIYIQEYWSTRFDFLIDNLAIPIIGADHGGNDSLAIKFHKQKSLPKAYKLQCQTFKELEIVKSYADNAELIPNGVDTDFYCPLSESFHSRHSNTDKTILTVARADDRQKRTSDLLKALQKLDSSWSLQIAGVGKDLKYLQTLASKLNISERVHFLGFINDKSELREKYRQCSVFALPSAREGLPFAVLEAMSCGCAVVATDIRAFDDLVIHNKTGIKVPVEDPLLLAQGILRCYENRKIYGRLGRQIIVDYYSKRKLFSRLSQIINLCLDLPKNSVELSNR